MSELTDLHIKKIIKIASELDLGNLPAGEHIALGQVKYNPRYIDSLVLQAMTARIGASVVSYDLHQEFVMRESEILTEMLSLSSVVDLLITTIIDLQTFGSGHRLTEKIMDGVNVPVLSLRDDLYSHPSALAEILALYDRFDAFKDKKIGVAWGYGSRFVLPSTAHSLVLLASQMGADVRIIEPEKFSLLKRVKKSAKELADQNGSLIEVSNDFIEGLQGLDAVFASNWCRLDDFQHPERNRDYAIEFKDWFFTRDNVPDNCCFLAEPPIQQELLASADLLNAVQNLSGTSYLRRVKILFTLIQYFIESKGKGIRLVFA